MGTERLVRMVRDEYDDSRTVDHVGKLHFKAVSKEAENDAFKQSADVIKGFSGTDSVFKRRVTNEMKKMNQSVDGEASSKQIDEPFDGYDSLGVIHPPYNLDYLAQLYDRVPAHHAAVDAKVANIVGLGYRFVETPKTKRLIEEQETNEKRLKKTLKTLDLHREELMEMVEDFHEDDTFSEMLSDVWRDVESTGNGYIEIGRGGDGKIHYVGHIPAQTMRVRRKRDGYVQLSGHRVQFFSNFVEKNNNQEEDFNNPIGSDRPNEVIHIKKTSPTNSWYGIPDIMAAQQAVAGNEFANRYNLDYFENKAIPRHLIILKGAKLGNQAESDLLQFFETNLKGQNHRSLFIPLPGDIQGGEKVEFTIEPIEAGVQDASFEKYKKMNDKDIYTVHRVPETKVSISGGGVNVAMAKDADKTFKEQVCAPMQRNLEKKLNRIIKEFTDAFELKLNELTLTDADTQSKIDERYVKMGAHLPNEVRTRDGMPMIDGGNERVDLNAKDKIAQAQAEERTQRERDSARSANGTDSNGAARSAKGEGRTQS